MQQPLAARRQAQPTGVIETLSAGYSVVNRHLWVLLLPILLDVFLWFGPHVSYSPLVGPAVTHATEWTRQFAFGPRRAPRNPDLLNSLDDSRQWLIDQADQVNGLALLAWGPIALPSLSALPGSDGELALVSRWVDAVILMVACIGVSLLLGGWFYSGLAVASSGAHDGLLTAGRGTLGAVVHVLGLVGVLLGTGLLLGLPVLLLIGFTALVAPPIALLGSVLVGAGALFAAVHLFFAIDAIFISQAGPLAAIQRSVGLVRTHLRPSSALIVLTWLILAGMARVWDLLASTLLPPYGVALGILGNAYIVSGLIAAGMIFYIQRTESTRAAVAGVPNA